MSKLAAETWRPPASRQALPCSSMVCRPSMRTPGKRPAVNPASLSMKSKRSQITMLPLGRPPSTSHPITASTSSGLVQMSGAPTGFTLSPTTSSGVKSRAKLFFMPAPVSVRMPRSSMARTTLASTASPASDLGSVTLTTRPGNGPGSANFPFGTFMNSPMLVSTSAGLVFSSPNAGTPRTRPPATAEAPPTARTNSRRLMSKELDIDLYIPLIAASPHPLADTAAAGRDGPARRRLRAHQSWYVVRRPEFPRPVTARAGAGAAPRITRWPPRWTR